MPFPQRAVQPVSPMRLPATFQGPGMTMPGALPPMPQAPQTANQGSGINPMSMMMQYMMWKRMADQTQQPLSGLGGATGFGGAWGDYLGGPTGAWGGGGLLGMTDPGTFQIPDISGSWFGGGGLGY